MGGKIVLLADLVTIISEWGKEGVVIALLLGVIGFYHRQREKTWSQRLEDKEESCTERLAERLKDKEERFAEKDGRIERLEQLIQEKDAQIAAQDNQLSDLISEITRRRNG